MAKQIKTSARNPDEVTRRTEIAGTAMDTARWARIMTKWLVTHSSKDGVKWRVVEFGGKRGHESRGIVDMIAIRKDHKPHDANPHMGDLFEIILIQVKGGKSPFPTTFEIGRMNAVKDYHRASKVVLTEWKKGKALRCYVLPDVTNPVPASEIFGPLPKKVKPPTPSTAVANA